MSRKQKQMIFIDVMNHTNTLDTVSVQLLPQTIYSKKYLVRISC